MAIKMRMPVRVTGVTLDKSSINLTTVWDTEQLTATISPNNAEDTAVTWSSSDPTVATVSTTWLVTCVSPWEATITVTTNDWGYTATCGVIDQSWWQPWANTIFYLPLETDLLDHSWNNYTFTTDWTVSLVSWDVNIPVCYINNGTLSTASSSYTFWNNDFTISYFVKIPSDQSSNYWGVFWFNGSQYGSLVLQYEKTSWYFGSASNTWNASISYPNTTNTWMYVVTIRDWNTFKSYINWTLYNSSSVTSFSIWQWGSTKLWIGMWQGVKIKNLYISKFILEDKARTAQEVSDYYDLTKADYWII